MWNYPQFDPVAISLGPIDIHWYALSYLVGIGAVWWHLLSKVKAQAIDGTSSSKKVDSKEGASKTARAKKNSSGKAAKKRAKNIAPALWTDEQISDMIFYGVFGVILGGRIGYVLFYGREALIQDPFSALKIWQGGMSFHGGLLGVIIAILVFCRVHKKTLPQVMDFAAPSIPIALGTGRLGNFINGELPGRVTDVPWAAIYPGESVGRHPSSLYQAFLEGVVLFTILWLFSRRPKPNMAVSSMFLLAYGCLRFISEFFREPDVHMGFVVFDWLTTGQLLSTPMILLGLGMLVYSYRQPLSDVKEVSN